MELKDRLKELRNLHGISASSLGKNLNKAESTVRMWEIGKAKPDMDTLIALSKIFNCSVDYLLGLTDVRNEDELKNILVQSDRLLEVVNKFDGDDKIRLIEALRLCVDYILRLDCHNHSDVIKIFTGLLHLFANLTMRGIEVKYSTKESPYDYLVFLKTHLRYIQEVDNYKDTLINITIDSLKDDDAKSRLKELVSPFI